MENKKDYFTYLSFMKKVMARVTADPMYPAIKAAVNPDYMNIADPIIRNEQIRDTAFKVWPYLNFSCIGGIWGDLSLRRADGSFQALYAVRTRDTAQKAFVAMGALMALIQHHIERVIQDHRARFDD